MLAHIIAHAHYSMQEIAVRHCDKNFAHSLGRSRPEKSCKNEYPSGNFLHSSLPGNLFCGREPWTKWVSRALAGTCSRISGPVRTTAGSYSIVVHVACITDV